MEGRITKQGLVGVIVRNNIGAMVEVNCETDFVARNKVFQQFVESVSMACIQHVSKMPINDAFSKVSTALSVDFFVRIFSFVGNIQVNFETDSLRAMQGPEGRNLGDELALMIGSVGENATLRRATCFKATEPITLVGITHPTQSVTTANVHLGKYGAIVAYKCGGDSLGNDVLQKNICQHIVGMNPSKMGVVDVDKPSDDKDEEKCLIHQDYLLDPTITVGELLNENALEIVDFNRFHCGENVATSEENVNLATATN